ncbi:MAG TPA: hypothetical protein PK286_04680 [Devosia sp.]|nr:hypothetical protein [Devosia sp.]
MKKAIVVAALLAATATPVLADPNCQTGGGGANFRFEVGIGKFTEKDQMEFDLIRARRAGINAETAERTWLGCLKITRRGPNGWITEYYDPDTFQLKPLDLRLPG